MTNTKFMTDSTADLPGEYLAEHDVDVLSLTYRIDDVEYPYDSEPIEQARATARVFYDRMRAGATPTTAMVNAHTYTEAFERYLKEGRDIIYLAFSSALSGSCHNAMQAAKELEEKYPERRIRVIDTLAASCGEGLLVHLAIEKHRSGASDDEVEAYINHQKQYLHSWFTVDDLVYLKRGGRISGTAALLGGMLNIKPVLCVNSEGKLIPLEKVQGRKRALKALVDHMAAQVPADYSGPIYLSHGDTDEGAETVAAMIKQRFNRDIDLVGLVSPIIGTHSGPGTVALFVIGDQPKA